MPRRGCRGLIPLADLTERLRRDADLFRRRGVDREADLLESVAEEVEATVCDYLHAELTVAKASEESGFAEKTTRPMVRGRIPDSRSEGSEGEIRVWRRDLPRKPAGDRGTHEKTSLGFPVRDADGDEPRSCLRELILVAAEAPESAPASCCDGATGTQTGDARHADVARRGAEERRDADDPSP